MLYNIIYHRLAYVFAYTFNHMQCVEVIIYAENMA